MAGAASSGSTAVRIVSISAAQNKRGKDCFEGGMKTGSFTWYKDMGGNSNWMYLAVVRCPGVLCSCLPPSLPRSLARVAVAVASSRARARARRRP